VSLVAANSWSILNKVVMGAVASNYLTGPNGYSRPTTSTRFSAERKPYHRRHAVVPSADRAALPESAAFRQPRASGTWSIVSGCEQDRAHPAPVDVINHLLERSRQIHRAADHTKLTASMRLDCPPKGVFDATGQFAVRIKEPVVVGAPPQHEHDHQGGVTENVLRVSSM